MESRLATLAALTSRLGGRVHLGAPAEEPAGVPLPTRWTELDALLSGGIPRGRLTDLVGGASSGKLSLLLALLRTALAEPKGEPRHAALVDLSGTARPGAPWARGRLLVVRPPDLAGGLRAADLLASSGALAVVGLEAGALALSGGLPEALRLRFVRLARETGTTIVACGGAPLFGSAAALRLELTPRADGRIEVAIARSRDGLAGRAVVPRPSCTSSPLSPLSPTRPPGPPRRDGRGDFVRVA